MNRNDAERAIRALLIERHRFEVEAARELARKAKIEADTAEMIFRHYGKHLEAETDVMKFPRLG